MTKSRLPTPATPAMPTRGLATTAGLVAPQGLLWVMAPEAAVIVLLAEAGLLVIVVLTALFAPDHVSRRAFRVLSGLFGRND